MNRNDPASCLCLDLPVERLRQIQKFANVGLWFPNADGFDDVASGTSGYRYLSICKYRHPDGRARYFGYRATIRKQQVVFPQTLLLEQVLNYWLPKGRKLRVCSCGPPIIPTNRSVRPKASAVEDHSRLLFPLSFALSVLSSNKSCPGSSRVPKEDKFLGDTLLKVPRLHNNAQNMIQMSELATGSFESLDTRRSRGNVLCHPKHHDRIHVLVYIILVFCPLIPQKINSYFQLYFSNPKTSV